MASLSSSSSEEETYEVEKVVGKRKRSKRIEYRVRWKGYSSEHDSWEPVSNLAGCSEAIQLYNEKYNREEFDKKPQINRRVVAAKQFYSTPTKLKKSARVTPIERPGNSTKHRMPNPRHKLQLLDRKKIILQRTPVVEARKLPVTTIPIRLSRFTEQAPRAIPSSVQVVTSSLSGVAAVVPFTPSHTAYSVVPQKIFTVGEKQNLIQKWLGPNSGVTHSRPVVRDHDYIKTSTFGDTRKLLAKPTVVSQVNIEVNPPSGERKSTLRKGRVFQERLVHLQWRENFVEVIFANAAKGNALTPRFLDELSSALDAVIASKVAVVVIRTVGGTFCSGLDLKFMIDALSSSKSIRDTAKYLADNLRKFVDKLIDFPKLLIAVVQGPAVCLGCTMLTLFDTVYCSDKAWFWTPYTDMGQTPEACSSALFPEIMGPVTANDMLLNGSRMSAHEAKFKGLVTEVFPHDYLTQHTTASIEKIASKCSEAMQLTKGLIRSMNTHRLKHVNYCESNELVERWSSQDATENFTKFLQAMK